MSDSEISDIDTMMLHGETDDNYGREFGWTSNNVFERPGRANYDWTSSSSSEGGRSGSDIRGRRNIPGSRNYPHMDGEPSDHLWRGDILLDTEDRYRWGSLPDCSNASTRQLYLRGRRNDPATSEDRFDLGLSDNESDFEREHMIHRRWLSPGARRVMRWTGARNHRASTDIDDQSNWMLNREADDRPHRRENRPRAWDLDNREARNAARSVRVTRSRSRERDWHRDDRWRIYDYGLQSARPVVVGGLNDSLLTSEALYSHDNEEQRGRSLFR